MIRRAINALRAWSIRADIEYLEIYLAALGRQPRPEEAYMRHIRGLIGQAYIRLAAIEPQPGR